MAKRRKSSRGSSGWKSTATKFVAGAGAASLLGGGILGYGAGFLLGGIPGVAGAFLAPQAAGLIQGFTGGSRTSSGGSGFY